MKKLIENWKTLLESLHLQQILLANGGLRTRTNGVDDTAAALQRVRKDIVKFSGLILQHEAAVGA